MGAHARHFTAGRTDSGKVTRGQRSTADQRMDAHVARRRRCTDGDVCVHPGMIFTRFFCTKCDRQI